MASAVHILFRVVYATLYTLLHIILVALLLITPGDLINQARTRHNVYPILIVSAVYVGGILIVVFVYFARLYITRSVLNSIPKAWIPIDHGDVRPPVRRMIVAGLSRSAAVAFVSRPRALSSTALLLGGRGDAVGGDAAEGPGDGGGGAPSVASGGAAVGGGDPERKAVRFAGADAPASGAEKAMERELGIDLPPCRPVWGVIEHGGWSPPLQLRCDGGESGDGCGVDAALALPADVPPLLPYSTVVAELPSLVEATALMLAPRDPAAGPHEPPRPDPDAMDVLQRPVHMGLRDYLAQLVRLGVLDAQDRGAGAADGNGDGDGDGGHDNDARPLGAVVLSFAAAYEYARFSTQPLSYAAFRQLMQDLATILRRMRPLDPGRLYADDSEGGEDPDDDVEVDDDDIDDDDLYGVEDSGREMLSDGHYDGDDDGDNHHHPARANQATALPRSRVRGAMARRRLLRMPPSARVRPASGSASASSSGRRRSSSSGGSSSRSNISSQDSRSWKAPQTPAQPPTYTTHHHHHQRPPPPRASSSSRSTSSSVRTTVQHGPGGAASIRTTASGGTSGSSGSSGSVIRLAERGEEARARGLPFVLMAPGER